MPLGCRPLLALLGLPVLALVAGLLTFGAHSSPAQKAPRADTQALAAAGCAQHALKYGGMTDDPRVMRQQLTFESAINVVTEPGFYTNAKPYLPTLHAASHGSVVVFYRPDALTPDGRAALERLSAAAAATKAPVVIAPRTRAEQPQALVALGLGAELACPTAHAAQATRIRAFAAGVYPSVKS